jgi:OmpA-OmpF porin, OOP family
MTRLIFISLSLLTIHFSNAQLNQKFNRISFESSYGVNRPTFPLSPDFENDRIMNPTSVSSGFRYMTNEIFGIQGSFNFNRFKFLNTTNSEEYFSKYYRTSLEGYVNVLNALNLNKKPPKINLFFHMGGGFSILHSALTLSNVNWKNDYSDILINFVIGMKTQYKINRFMSYNIDFSIIPHLNQTFTWDMYSSAKQPGFDGIILDFTTGFSWYIGKSPEHYDWKRKF